METTDELVLDDIAQEAIRRKEEQEEYMEMQRLYLENGLEV